MEAQHSAPCQWLHAFWHGLPSCPAAHAIRAVPAGIAQLVPADLLLFCPAPCAAPQLGWTDAVQLNKDSLRAGLTKAVDIYLPTQSAPSGGTPQVPAATLGAALRYGIATWLAWDIWFPQSRHVWQHVTLTVPPSSFPGAARGAQLAHHHSLAAHLGFLPHPGRRRRRNGGGACRQGAHLHRYHRQRQPVGRHRLGSLPHT